MGRLGLTRWIVAALAAAVVSAVMPASASAATGPDVGGSGPAAAPPSIGTVLRTPPMGWANWNSLGCNYDDAKIRQVADEMVASGLRDAGYRVIRIQECIFPTRDSQGNLVPDPAKFPYGLKSLVDYIHSKGLLAGVYTDAGTRTCAGYQGSYDHEQQDADSFAAWGFDWVEVDWCNIPFGDFPGQSHEQVAETLITRMHNAIARTGRPMALYTFTGWDSSTNPWQWGPGIANAWRTGPDITTDLGNMQWANIVRNFELNAQHPEAAGPGHYNDPDMMGVGLPGISDLEGQSHFSLWAISAAPLSIGTDITDPSQFTPATRATYLNKEVIAVDQDPLDAQGTLLSDDGHGHQVWRKPMADGSVTVAFFNMGSTTQTMSTTAAALGLPAHERYIVRDLWAHKSVVSTGTVWSTARSHQVTMYRVWPADDTAAVAPATEVGLTSGRWVQPGGTYQAAITVRNDSPVAIQDVTARLTLPAGWTGAPAGGPDAVPALPPGASATFAWQFTVSPDALAGTAPDIGATTAYQWGGSHSTAATGETVAVGDQPAVSDLQVDQATQGNWIGTYGTTGYDVVGDAEQLPAGAGLDTSGDSSPYVWDPGPADSRALQRASGTGRIAATLFGDTVTLGVLVPAGTTERVGLYLLDWDGATSGLGIRDEAITVTDALGDTLATADSGQFTNGEYVSWQVSGAVTITLQRESGANAVVSGVFFDPVH